MRIPKQFKLMGQTFSVEFDETLINERDWTGSASYRRNKISIMPDCAAHPRNHDQLEHTFCHELIHHILYYAGPSLKKSEDIHQDEGFVDILAGLLHQALTTMEYE